MGCLKRLISAIILVLAFIGFKSIGGVDYVVDWYNNITHNSQSSMLEKTKKIGDFSRIGEEFEIAKSVNALGYSGVLAEHTASGQKMIVVDSGLKPLLTPEDFQEDKVEKKLHDLTKKFKYQYINVEDLKITKKGSMRAFDDNAQYVRFNAKVKNLPIGEVSGIIAAVENNDGENRLLLSVNEKNKYSQLIAEEFFRKIH